jgi:hypothetical protein
MSLSTYKQKTITELVIDKEMKNMDEVDELDIIEEDPDVDVEHEKLKVHPNIFKRLLPHLNIKDFT